MGMPINQAQFLPRTITLGVSILSRKAIEAEIERLIDLLDTIDGDADLEPDHEDFDECDPGEMVEYMSIKPKYGKDQSRGPTNRRAAYEQYYEEVFCSER